MDRFKGLIQELKNKGYKITRQREAILKVLGETDHQLLTAQGIFEKVTQTNPGTNFSTVYRNLELLLKEDIIKKVELERDAAYYELSQSGDHHHHLICKGCGNIKKTDFCPFKKIEDEDGFTPVEHRFEVYGYCKDCKEINRDKV